MKRKRLLALLLSGTLLFLTACQHQESEQPEGSVTSTPSASSEPSPEVVEETATPEVHRPEFALGCDSGSTLDPLSEAGIGASNQALTGLVYEGLFELDNTFEPQPLLCTTYTANTECTEWTFSLRTDAVFSDGTPLTAAHVVDSLKTARSSSLYATRLAGVRDISVSEGAVTVSLSAPNGALPALLDIPITLSSGDDTSAPLGTGPYFYVLQDEVLSLQRNPHWWQKQSLPLESIPLREVVTTEERIAAFDTGTVTVTTAELTGTNALGYSGSYETWDCASSSLMYLGFNTKKGVCRDTALRRAVSLGITRTNIAESLLSGHAEPTFFPFHPDSTLYDTALAESQSAVDPAQLLQDGGYTLEDGALTQRGQQVELKLVVNTDNSFRTNVADTISMELAKLGLSVTVTALAWEDFLKALDRGNFDLYLAQVKLTPDFDLSALLSGSLNYGGYSNQELTNLLSTYRAATGAARTVAARNLCVALAAQMPIAPLCFLHTSVLTQWGAVSGLNPTQQNPFHQFYQWSIAS